MFSKMSAIHILSSGFYHQVYNQKGVSNVANRFSGADVFPFCYGVTEPDDKYDYSQLLGDLHRTGIFESPFP